MKILLVDDNAVELLDLIRILKNNGHVLRSTTSPVTALALYELEKIDTVITDLKMPLGNGIDLMKGIYKLNKNAKIIVMSGSDNNQWISEVVNNGAFGFLKKPFIESKLIRMLKEIEEYGTD